MKLSKWNSYITLNENFGLVYNAFTDSFIVVKPNSMDLVYAQRGELDKFSDLFKEQMLAIGGLVKKTLDESNEIDKLILSTDFDKSTLRIIINPTLNCNFKCWYCYEKHIQDSCMSERIQNALIVLIEKRINKHKETSQCQLSFFGGEPLLKFKEVIHPIVTKVSNICKQYGVKLSLQFTTNAFLLNNEMIDFFKCHSSSFQVTLDGDKNEHNKTRFGKKGEPSYDVILKNISNLATAKLPVILRINYTTKNIESCRDLIFDLDKISYPLRDFIVIDFQRVWQDAPIIYEDDTDVIAKELSEILQIKKYKISDNKLSNPLRNPCYADYFNEFLVNYNGDIFFCTARDFNSENRAGFLKENGEIVWKNDHYFKRLSCKFRKPICRSCRIAPICGGGCRTKCMETFYNPKCNLGYSEEDIENLILDRFMHRYM